MLVFERKRVFNKNAEQFLINFIDAPEIHLVADRLAGGQQDRWEVCQPELSVSLLFFIFCYVAPFFTAYHSKCHLPQPFGRFSYVSVFL